MQIISFPAHYQSVYTNFDISSFSLISCIATVALSAFKCGSFASLKRANENFGELFRWLEAGFPFRMESFVGSVFVNIIRLHPASCRDTFYRFSGVWPVA